MKNKKQNVHMDVPYHIEFLRKDEFDNRRHKSRCKFYNKDTKKCDCYNCLTFSHKCIGSAHCIKYKEKTIKSVENEKTDEFNTIKEKVIVDRNNITNNNKIVNNKNYVDYGAKITIQNLKDNGTKKFIIKEMQHKPLIQELTMNKNINYEFEYMGEKYKIIEINYNY